MCVCHLEMSLFFKEYHQLAQLIRTYTQTLWPYPTSVWENKPLGCRRQVLPRQSSTTPTHYSPPGSWLRHQIASKTHFDVTTKRMTPGLRGTQDFFHVFSNLI